ncbi:gag protease polyprotein [Cucumis melo var. makuwa]|uniref:Gag protease polyprotein n=1 Tax=Cucumis melo var. makuwa TaxID=1194695 RepID=A0A5D3CAF2_CUCMM|nr:gag protease polyprotein [Cucumis melo var. makuwa]TYK08184.1 gag protease polyprotein [Cucumis melo var. makuwa]
MEIVSCHTTSTTEEDAFPSNAMEETPKPGDLLPLGINDLLTLSREVKDTIIEILKIDEVSTIVTSPTKVCDSCYNGSAVNILSKSTMNQLGISMEELSNSKLVIQGFNQGAQKAIDTVRLEIVIRDLQASTIFHVIDSRTTYKMLLGRPWIHENGIVTSTLHQCFKFYKQGIRKVDADSRPFTKVESHFVDAKFYTKSEDVSEVISTEVPVTKGTFKNEPELSPTQKKLQKQGYSIPNSRAGIGYQSFEPVRITVFKRVSRSIAEDKNQASTCGSTRLSAFQRLNTNAKKVQSISPTPTTRKSAFRSLSVSVTRGQKKASISVSNKSSLVIGDEKICSAVPSRMKRKMFVSVNTEEETSDHDTFEEDAEAALLSLEDGGQSMIDELKEVNLGTKEEPRLTFISTQISNGDENEYVNLLKAYKDVFAWSYKEMPGLDPKVAVHRLAIKPEHQPAKQAQRRF